MDKLMRENNTKHVVEKERRELEKGLMQRSMQFFKTNSLSSASKSPPSKPATS